MKRRHPDFRFLMGGVVGLLFREFAVTVAVSILVSVVVSLTLTPTLCARLVPARHDGKPGWISSALERFFDWLVQRYDSALQIALHHQRTALAVMVATIAGYWPYMSLRHRFPRT